MKTIAKLLAPATLALAALSANAGVTEIDYPADVIQSRSAASGEWSAAAAGVGTGLNLLHSESAVRDEAAVGFTPPTREEVRSRIDDSRETDVGYFA